MQGPHRSPRLRRLIAPVAAAAACVSLVAVAPAVADEKAATGAPEVVADGLDNPRHVAVGSGGQVYVAQAGAGGDVAVEITREGEAATICAGVTGAVTDVAANTTLANFPSVADPAEDTGECPGDFATTGSQGVDVDAAGNVAVTVGLGGDADVRTAVETALPEASVLGTAQLLPAGGGDRSTIADLTAFEVAANPDGQFVDSNPYGIASLDDGTHLVVDAGGNTLLQLAADGTPTLVAVFAPQCVPFTAPFPNPIPDAANPCGGADQFPAESVPTDVVAGPDGRLYVSELIGFPFTAGTSRVWAVDPGRTTPAVCSTFAPVPNDGCEIYAEGLTSLVALDFGDDGSLYAVQFADAGVLAAETGGSLDGSVQIVPPGGGTPTDAIGGLSVPGGVAVDGSDVYVTNFSIFPGQGQLLRFSRGTGPDCAGLTPTIVGSGTIVGTSGDDVILGSDGDDVIRGLQGDDVICGLGGNDRLYGDGHADIIHAGDGDDVVYGSWGADQLFGEGGDDFFSAGSGWDLVDGGEGDDEGYGGPGQDTLLGGPGDDQLDGALDDDLVVGDDGDDLLAGGAGDDDIEGGTGADTLKGGDDDDTLLGGPDDDVLLGGLGQDVLDGEAGDDALWGGPGDDTCTLQSADADRSGSACETKNVV